MLHAHYYHFLTSEGTDALSRRNPSMAVTIATWARCKNAARTSLLPLLNVCRYCKVSRRNPSTTVPKVTTTVTIVTTSRQQRHAQHYKYYYYIIHSRYTWRFLSAVVHYVWLKIPEFCSTNFLYFVEGHAEGGRGLLKGFLFIILSSLIIHVDSNKYWWWNNYNT